MATHCIRHLSIRTPQDMLSIAWEADGSSGSTQCEAWRLQYEVDRLVSAGYVVNNINLFK